MCTFIIQVILIVYEHFSVFFRWLHWLLDWLVLLLTFFFLLSCLHRLLRWYFLPLNIFQCIEVITLIIELISIVYEHFSVYWGECINYWDDISFLWTFFCLLRWLQGLLRWYFFPLNIFLFIDLIISVFVCLNVHWGDFNFIWTFFHFLSENYRIQKFLCSLRWLYILFSWIWVDWGLIENSIISFDWNFFIEVVSNDWGYF